MCVCVCVRACMHARVCVCICVFKTAVSVLWLADINVVEPEVTVGTDSVCAQDSCKRFVAS